MRLASTHHGPRLLTRIPIGFAGGVSLAGRATFELVHHSHADAACARIIKPKRALLPLP
jgi:hypothetical protein